MVLVSDISTCHCCLAHSPVLTISGVDCAPQKPCGLLWKYRNIMLYQNLESLYIDYPTPNNNTGT